MKKDPLLYALLASTALILAGQFGVAGEADWLRELGALGLILTAIGFAERIWKHWRAERRAHNQAARDDDLRRAMVRIQPPPPPAAWSEPVRQTATCPSCGVGAATGAKFCPNCGATTAAAARA